MAVIILLRILIIIMVAIIFCEISIKLISWKVPQVRMWLRRNSFNNLEEKELEVENAVSDYRKRHTLVESLRQIDSEQDKMDRDTLFKT